MAPNFSASLALMTQYTYWPRVLATDRVTARDSPADVRMPSASSRTVSRTTRPALRGSAGAAGLAAGVFVVARPLLVARLGAAISPLSPLGIAIVVAAVEHPLDLAQE